eukprot:EG_transcript_5454
MSTSIRWPFRAIPAEASAGDMPAVDPVDKLNVAVFPPAAQLQDALCRQDWAQAVDVFEARLAGVVPLDADTYAAVAGAAEQTERWAALALVWHDCQRHSVPLDVPTHHRVLRAAAHLPSGALAAEVARFLERRGLALDARTYGLLFDALGASGEPELIWAEYERMGGRPACLDGPAVDSVVHALSRGPFLDAAFHVVAAARSRRIAPTVVTYLGLLRACRKAVRLDSAHAVLATMERDGVALDAACYHQLIRLYTASAPLVGRELWAMLLDEAFRVLPTMVAKGVAPGEVTFVYLLLACRLDWRDPLGRALRVLQRMADFNLTANVRHYSAAMHACSQLDEYEAVRLLFERMKQNGIPPNVVAFSTAIYAAVKYEQPELVRELHREMLGLGIAPNGYTYYALLLMCQREGALDEALDLFSEMLAAGVAPSIYAYNALLLTHARVGAWRPGVELFQTMLRSGVEPTPVTIGAALALLLQGRQWAAILDLSDRLQGMGVTPNYYILNAILVACVQLRDGPRATRAFRDAAAEGCGARLHWGLWGQAWPLVRAYEGQTLGPAGVPEAEWVSTRLARPSSAPD